MATVKGPAEVRYDARADVLYLRAGEGEVAKSVELAAGITVEYSDGGEIIGVEVLRASRVLGEKVVASLHAKQAGVIG